MAATPLVTALVAVHDGEEYVRAALASILGQTVTDLEVVVVDDASVDATPEILGSVDDTRLRVLRNGEQVDADLVAFPDDDCVYPAGLLERVVARFADRGLDGLTGRAVDAEGHSSGSWKSDPALLTDDNLWNRAISFTIFLRREVVECVGAFDERLGLGSTEPWSSGEEIDYLIRAVRSRARIVYDPSLVVRHPVRQDDRRIGARDGATVGYLLRKHGYPVRVVARMLVRPLGGMLASLVRLDGSRAGYQLATFRGRVRGYRGAKRANSSA